MYKGLSFLIHRVIWKIQLCVHKITKSQSKCDWTDERYHLEKPTWQSHELRNGPDPNQEENNKFKNKSGPGNLKNKTQRTINLDTLKTLPVWLISNSMCLSP